MVMIRKRKSYKWPCSFDKLSLWSEWQTSVVTTPEVNIYSLSFVFEYFILSDTFPKPMVINMYCAVQQVLYSLNKIVCSVNKDT